MNSESYDNFSSTTGFVATNADSILVVFRGTNVNEILDTLTNGDTILKTTWSGLSSIHQGFYRAFFKVWGQPFGDDKSIIFPDVLLKAGKRKIWMTGHSLGGALAQICAAQTEWRGRIPVHSVYTFGQPRIGNNDFAKQMNDKMGDKIFRVIYDKDTVTRLGPFSMGYRHYGNSIVARGNDITFHKSEVETSYSANDAYNNMIYNMKNLASFDKMMTTFSSIVPNGKTFKQLHPNQIIKAGHDPIMHHLIPTYLKFFRDYKKI